MKLTLETQLYKQYSDSLPFTLKHLKNLTKDTFKVMKVKDYTHSRVVYRFTLKSVLSRHLAKCTFHYRVSGVLRKLLKRRN